MQLKCAQCSRKDAKYVCHHCSRPLCEGHVWLREDWVFNPSQPTNLPDWLRPWWRRAAGDHREAAEARAAHCEACYRLNHGKSRWLYQLWDRLRAH